jgi:hypothetical protein
MKKLLRLIAVMLMGLTTVNGQKIRKGEDFKTDRYRFAEPIIFVERGVEFLIFPDGSFDFNTNIEDTYYNANTYYRISSARRSSVNVNFEAPSTVSRIHYSAPSSRGVLILHDRDGKVRRIGNVFINYDREGRITRAGSVYMKYQRGNGNLRQVGALIVNYNHWGEIVHVSGVVNYYNAHINYIVGADRWDNDHYYYDFDHHDHNNFYYYRKGGEVKKQKKVKTKRS